MKKTMNHAEYQKSLKSKSVETLKFIIRDASEAAAINPDNPNVGFYLDCLELRCW